MSSVFRKILFWMHLVAGVTAGAVILLMSVTGVLLTYEKQIVAWADRSVADLAESPARPIETLLTALPGATSVTLRANPREPSTVTLGSETVMVDSSTGRSLGPPPAGVRVFFRFVTDWHRWLGQNGPGRNTARAITGASNLLFLFLVVSGLYLWFPRVWNSANLRARIWFRGGLSGKARDFNWHNVVGFWCCVPLFFVVLSGVVMSYPWANDLLYRANGVQTPNRGKGAGKGKTTRNEKSKETSLENLNLLLDKAKQQNREWRAISFQVPGRDELPVTFNIDAGSGGQPQRRSTVTLDRATTAILRSTAFSDQDAGQRARSWMRFVHTGEYYGVVGQTIAGLASAGGAFLVWTGIALSYRRFRAWTARR